MKLFLFGSLRIEHNETTQLLTGNTAALLSYLALQNNHPIPRTKVAGTLFPDVSESQARRLLTHTLYRLRREIDATCLVVDSATVALRDVWTDVTAFQKLGAEGSYRAALELYVGDLLESADHEWLLGQRALLREQFLQFVEKQIAEYLSENAFEPALLLAKRWVQVNPLDETAHVCVMQLYAKMGKSSAALQQYDNLVALLDAELGVAPLPSTAAVMEEIRPKPTPNRLIGRRHERAQLLAHLKSDTLILLEGDAGIGKTHLLKDVMAALQWRSINVAYGKAVEIAQPKPYAPLVTALQDAIAIEPNWLTKLTPAASRAINTLFSESSAVFGKPISLRVLQMAIRQLMSVLTAKHKLVIVFDDVQWADGAFWAFLPTLIEIRPITVILSYRSREMRENQMGWRALSDLEQAVAPTRIELGGFSESEVSEFVTQQGQSFSSDHLHQLHKTSRGNPFLLRELLRTDGATELERLLAQRLVALTATERRAIDALSVVGEAISAEKWHALLQSPPPIQSLQAKQIIVAGYTFEHDLLRLHVYEALSAEDRKRWHRRYADLVADIVDPATVAWHYATGDVPTLAIQQYQRAAEIALSLSDFATAHRMAERAQAVGEDSLQLRILQLQVIEAERYSSANLVEIEQLLPLVEDSDRLRLLRLRFKALSAQGEIEAVREAGEEAIRMSREVGDIAAEIEIHLAVANQIVVTERDVQAALNWTDHALQLAENAAPHLLVEALLMKVHLHARLPNRNAAELAAYLERADQLIATHLDLRPLETDLRFHQAIVAQVMGDLETAWRAWCELATTYERDGADRPLRSARYNAAQTSMFLGQHEEAMLFAEQLVQTERGNVAEQDNYYVSQFRSLLVETYTMAGELDAAEKEVQTLLKWLAQEPEGNAARHAWNTIGSVFFYKMDFDAAYDAHSRALALIPPTMQTTAAPFLYICEVAFKLNKLSEARDYLRQSAERLNFAQPTSNTIFYHYLDHLINGQLAPLATARQQLLDFAAQIKSPRIRHDYLHRMPFHRDIALAWREAVSEVQTVWLTKAEHPVGKVVIDTDRRKIEWTVDAGELDSAETNKVRRRRQRLQRLIHEATVQGTTPTQAELATALNVTTRTIQRDVAMST